MHTELCGNQEKPVIDAIFFDGPYIATKIDVVRFETDDVGDCRASFNLLIMSDTIRCIETE